MGITSSCHLCSPSPNAWIRLSHSHLPPQSAVDAHPWIPQIVLYWGAWGVWWCELPCWAEPAWLHHQSPSPPGHSQTPAGWSSGSNLGSLWVQCFSEEVPTPYCLRSLSGSGISGIWQTTAGWFHRFYQLHLTPLVVALLPSSTNTPLQHWSCSSCSLGLEDRIGHQISTPMKVDLQWSHSCNWQRNQSDGTMCLCASLQPSNSMF